MDSIKPSPHPNRSRLSKTIRKLINLKNPQKTHPSRCFEPNSKQLKRESAAEAMEASQNRAFLARLFAAVSSIKAAYAELQLAQLPYDNDAVQSADQSVVDELKSISELKRRFMKNQIDTSPPHVTLLLAEIQEQQSLLRIYEISMKKMQDEIEIRAKKISFLKEDLSVITRNNRGLERKLNASGPFSVLDGVRFSDSNPAGFVLVLNYAMRSVRNFVRFLIREMETANWDIRAAANAIQPGVDFGKREQHRAYAFESFVCSEVFCGFNDPIFSIREDNGFILPGDINQRRLFFFEEFEKLKSTASLIQFLRQNPNSLFGKFLKSKYLQFVHPKMEFSFFGNLNQRKMVMSSGEYPGTEFFKVFAEMCRRVWILHCLAFSFEHEVGVFHVEKKSKFSEVYMESIEDDIFAPGTDGEFRVAFTVVPGFKLHRTVVQSQVYLFPSGSNV